jgi:prepilin peptidase CpaA
MLGELFEHHPPSALRWGVVLCAAAVAMATDIRSRRIPNVLTLPLLLTGLIEAIISRGGLHGLLDALAGCLILGIPYVLLFLFAGGGGGDAKLMGAIGAWLGVSQGVVVLVCVTICGAVLGLAFAALRRQLAPVLRNMRMIGQGVWCAVAARKAPGDVQVLMPDAATMLKMPYGIAICAGVCVAATKVFLWNT